MKVYQILLLEDVPEILERNRAALTAQGHAVSAAATLEEARGLTAARQFDLLILDILLPDGSGLELCRELRDKTDAPILFLTAMGDSDQIVRGLGAGGDDYITKPYRVEELVARVEAQLRRTERLLQAGALELGPLRLDANTRRAYLSGVEMLLSPKEYQILALLLRKSEQPLSSAEIFAQVWGVDANKDVRTVRVHISHLRAKLRECGGEDVIGIERSEPEGYRIALEEQITSDNCGIAPR